MARTTCQLAFRRINLHWHDLRHEYASRLVERGVPLAQVRDLLGHASITTTERYDNQKLENLQVAVLKLESSKSFDVSDANRIENRVGQATEQHFVRERGWVLGTEFATGSAAVIPTTFERVVRQVVATRRCLP